jgi:hypothetical protein
VGHGVGIVDDIGPGGAAHPVTVVAAHCVVGDDEADYESDRQVLPSVTSWDGGVRNAPITVFGIWIIMMNGGEGRGM